MLSTKFFALAALCFVWPGLAQDHPPAAAKSAPAGFPDLVGGLKATPGCLGVETARTSSGKNVIFAWFENKKAALNWYYSDMHQSAMNRFFPNRPAREPLQGVAEDSGPIMAIASLTMADKSQLQQTSLPFSQIAIELYQPLPGGLALGSRFAPDSVKVPRMVYYPSSPASNSGAKKP
jgi:hypothetical protein